MPLHLKKFAFLIVRKVLKKVKKALKKKFINNLNLNINKNSYLALLGKNGSGKSTLIKLMFGIEQMISGDIKVFEKSIKDDPFEIYKTAGLVFQNPDEQIVSSTIELDVAFAMENYSVPSKDINKKIDEVLAFVGLSDKRKCNVASLSGGEKQRLCIASSLVLNPKILVLDEPTSMLDSVNRAKIIELLKNIHSMGTTIIVVTHNVNEIEHCNDVVFMDNGSIAFEGTKENFVDSLIKNKEYHKLDMPLNFSLASELYFNKNVSISKDIFDYKKVCEHLWKLN